MIYTILLFLLLIWNVIHQIVETWVCSYKENATITALNVLTNWYSPASDWPRWQDACDLGFTLTLRSTAFTITKPAAFLSDAVKIAKNNQRGRPSPLASYSLHFRENVDNYEKWIWTKVSFGLAIVLAKTRTQYNVHSPYKQLTHYKKYNRDKILWKRDIRSCQLKLNISK